jgi:hypothetical protein
VQDSSGQIISQWRVDVGLGDHVLGPAERREFQIPWDGRTTSRNLVGPGRYSVSLQPEATGSSASTKTTIEIEDAGPIVTVQQSDIDRDSSVASGDHADDERFRFACNRHSATRPPTFNLFAGIERCRSISCVRGYTMFRDSIEPSSHDGLVITASRIPSDKVAQLHWKI